MNKGEKSRRSSAEQRPPQDADAPASGARKSEEGSRVVPLPEVHADLQKRYEPFALTDTQQADLIGRSDSVEFGNVGRHCYFELDVEDWNRERFESALRTLIERHEMLRAVILSDGRQQILRQVPPYRIECTDLRARDAFDAAEQLKALREVMSHHLHRPEQWPLFEFRASLLNGGRTRLHISVDLLIADI